MSRLPNHRAFIIATGPSLTKEDCRYVCDLAALGHWDVYCVSNSYLLCDHIDVLYACDEAWWDSHESTTRGLNRWTCNEEAAKKYNLMHVAGEHSAAAGIRFDASRKGIIYGGNSGFQTLNLAYMRGARVAYLLGFDMGYDAGTPKHFFGEHPASFDNPSDYNDWIRHFDCAVPEICAAGMTVINATRKTRLESFPMLELESIK